MNALRSDHSNMVCMYLCLCVFVCLRILGGDFQEIVSFVSLEYKKYLVPGTLFPDV